MNFAATNISCGIYQIFEMHRNPAWLVYTFVKEAYRGSFRGNNAFIVFSDIVGARNGGDVSGDYGERFARYLEDNQLVRNPVERSVIQVNPNSGNRIRVYLANIGNKDTLIKFVEENFKEEPSRYVEY